MFKNILLKILGLVLCVSQAQAISVDWNGTYRLEWTELDRPSLGTPYMRKAYGLQSLSLSPHIIASDGVNIVSRVEMLTSSDSAYSSNQMGQLWGAGYTQPPTSSATVNTTSRSKPFFTPEVSQLYLNVNQEYGAFVAGRAPYEFGLGITHNAGDGIFDHWYNNRDLVSYRFIVGNTFFQPTIARVYQADAGQGNWVQDEMYHLEYNSADKTSQLGVVIEKRSAASGANDANTAVTGSTVNGTFATQRTNFILGRMWDEFGFKLEGGSISGDMGIQSGGANVRWNAYGIASEFYFPRPQSKWNFTLKAGVASGDDPNTTDVESYYFDRNYKIAFLLFSHRLGAADFLGTNKIKDTTKNQSNSMDDETISNASYLVPQVKYAWSDKVDLVGSLAYAQLMTNTTNSVGFKKDLGIELDMELIYKPRERVTWSTQLGLLSPGQAFQDGNNKRDNNVTYGWNTRAAITF